MAETRTDKPGEDMGDGALSLVEALWDRAEREPDTVAHVMLRDGEEPGASVTYGELRAEAAGIAARLRRAGLAGERVVLCFPTGLEFIASLLGCQWAGVVSAPVKVPARRDGLARLRGIAQDAGARTVLTTRAVHEELVGRNGADDELRGLAWLVVDEPRPARDEPFAEPDVDPDGLALLQYTSGSTGSPRGVMVTHRNLCANAAELNRLWPGVGAPRVVSWLPQFHDMGLLFGVVLPLWAGFPAYLMAPDAFIRRPMRWLEAIDRFRGTHSAAPNFAYELCLSSAADVGLPQLDLSSWHAAVNGAEPVRWSTLERFAATFAPHGLDPRALCPGYGLAEHTLKVSGARPDEKPQATWVATEDLARGRAVPLPADHRAATPVVSCGAADPWTDVRIVDPSSGAPREDGEVGEIWLRGPCVARGYWGREAETAATFGALLDDRTYLRTGDLGFLMAGELHVTGRLKDVIVRFGRNHYPQDIEQIVEDSRSGLHQGCCVAFPAPPRAEGQGERVVLAVEVGGRALAGTSATGLRADIAAAVKDRHGLAVDEVVLVRRGTLPRTSSGKVRRRACRVQYVDGTLKRFSEGRGDQRTGARR
ncbi:fatty acyl-AMP ligase [Streptomyces sp. NPDC048441]|uniref:fatty acyl-AMP ligase n=1 Tax=Streptomyces sp. NPDC048441 TaxID=3365552 RepID=UPI0037126093